MESKELVDHPAAEVAGDDGHLRRVCGRHGVFHGILLLGRGKLHVAPGADAGVEPDQDGPAALAEPVVVHQELARGGDVEGLGHCRAAQAGVVEARLDLGEPCVQIGDVGVHFALGRVVDRLEARQGAFGGGDLRLVLGELGFGAFWASSALAIWECIAAYSAFVLSDICCVRNLAMFSLISEITTSSLRVSRISRLTSSRARFRSSCSAASFRISCSRRTGMSLT